MITLTVLKRHFVTYYFGCATNLRKRHARKLDFVGPTAALQLFSFSPSEELCGAKSISLVCDLRVMSKHSEGPEDIYTVHCTLRRRLQWDLH